MAHKYEIYRGQAGEYRVRFKYLNEVMGSSAGLSSKKLALDLIETLKKNAPDAPVEDNTRDGQSIRQRLEETEVPASDRLVRIDHNSDAFREFESAFEKLKEGLDKSNDVGELSPEGVEVAKQEVSQLGSENKREWVRPAHVWQVAKSTLLWILDHSAGAAIGTFALAALTALAKLFGIEF